MSMHKNEEVASMVSGNNLATPCDLLIFQNSQYKGLAQQTGYVNRI